MTVLEMQEQRLNLQTELSNIINQAETRSLEENENSRLVEIRSEIDNLDAQIKEEEKRNIEIKQNNTEIKEERKMVKLFDLINGVVNNNISDEQRAYVQGNKITFRSAIQAGVAGAGQENVPEEKKALDLAIRNASVLDKMGATWFSNAVGDVSIPKYWGSNVAWKGEVVAADDGASGFTETILQPKRLTAYIDISKTFLAQDSNDAEAILIADLARAVGEKLDKTVFGSESGTTERPAGLFYDSAYTVTGVSTLSAVTYDNVLDLEAKVEDKNGTDFIFIANPKVKYAYKGVQYGTGLKMVFENKELDGYPVLVSNSVAQKGIICMDPRDLAVATWANGLEITVDTTSRAIYNEIRVVVNYLVDAKLRGQRIAAEIYG